MRPVYRGMAVGILQCLIVASVAGKYAWDRERLPRVWAKAAPVGPNLPVRGRYVRMRLQVEAPPDAAQGTSVRVAAVGDRLVATADRKGTVHVMPWWGNTGAGPGGKVWVLAEPVAYFIPEHVPDPARRAPDEELWVQVSVPARGAPRPVRLGVKKNGILRPLGP